LKSDNKNISFPSKPSVELLAQYGVYAVTKEEIPAYDATAQRYDFDSLPVLENGVWTQKVRIVQLTTEEIAVARETTKQALTSAVQRVLDSEVQTHGYDNILSATSYLNSTNTVFAAEASAAVAWRDAVWSKCYEILTAVEAGTRTTPTEDELVAELPAMVWPN
jgi:hypothetical protein